MKYPAHFGRLISDVYADWLRDMAPGTLDAGWFWRRSRDRETASEHAHAQPDPTWYFRYMEDRESHRVDPSWIFQVTQNSGMAVTGSSSSCGS